MFLIRYLASLVLIFGMQASFLYVIGSEGEQEECQNNTWSSTCLVISEGKELQDLESNLREAQQEIKYLRSTLAWVINPFFPDINSSPVLAFRNRLQAEISTLFGKQKLGIEEETSYLMIVQGALDTGAEYIPISEVQAALKIISKVIEISHTVYETVQPTAEPYIFSSFAEIDRISYLVAAGVASIYQNQIEQLNDTQAITLASCAYDSLASFVRRTKSKGKAGISPDQLILALGKYYLGTVKKTFSLPGNIHRRATLIAYINDNPWWDMDLFLGTGIKVSDEGTPHYWIPNNEKYIYYNPHDMKGLVYVRAPNKSKIYGYRNGTQKYLTALNKETDYVQTSEPLQSTETLEKKKIMKGTLEDLESEQELKTTGGGTDEDNEG